MAFAALLATVVCLASRGSEESSSCEAVLEQEPLDTVKGYFGMRKGSLAKLPNDGPLFIHLNNKAIVQVGLLDQASPICCLLCFLNLLAKKLAV